MASVCQCTTLLPEQIIEVFNEGVKKWQICSILSIQTKHCSNFQTQSVCNTVLTLNIINTTDIIQSISCNEYNIKWRFLSPSKLAHAPPQDITPAIQTTICRPPKYNQLKLMNQTVQRKLVTPHADDVSSEDDDDDEEEAMRNPSRKRKFTQFATNSVVTFHELKDINSNTNNKPFVLPSITDNTDNGTISQRVSKRRRLNDLNNTCAPKSFLSMTRLKKKRPKPPVIMLHKTGEKKQNTAMMNKTNKDMNKAQKTHKKCITPTAKPTIKPPPKPPAPIIKRTPMITTDDDHHFDIIDAFRAKNDDKFPTLETIEKICSIRRYDARKIVLRYFECRESELKYILMETNEYRCTKCHQMYNNDGLGVDSLTKVKTHAIIHTDNAYKCPVCGKPFVNEYHLMYHLRQKKDAKNAHKKYYQKHHAATDSKKPKRVRKRSKAKKRTQNVRKQTQVNADMGDSGYHTNINGLPNLNYHDYNVNKNGAHTAAANGPPPLSPVPNEAEADKEVLNSAEALQLLASSPAPAPHSNNNNNNHNSNIVQYTSPPSPYDVAPLPISTTIASVGEMMSFTVSGIEAKEKEYPPVPLAPN